MSTMVASWVLMAVGHLRDGVALQEDGGLVDHFGPCMWKLTKKRKWIAYSRLHCSR